MPRLLGGLSAALLCSALLTALPAPSAQAEDLSTTRVRHPQGMVWDEAHSHLLLFDGADGVDVLDRDGGLVRHLDTPGLRFPTLSTTGDAVWAYDGPATLVRIDTSALTTTSMPIDDTTCGDGSPTPVATELVVDADAIWRGVDCGGYAPLERIDPGTGVIETVVGGGGGAWRERAGSVLPLPGRPSHFAYVADGGHFTVMSVERGADGVLHSVVQAQNTGWQETGRAMVASLDGTQAITASGYRYSLATAALLGEASSRHDGWDVAMDPSGDLAIASRQVRLQRAGETSPWRTYGTDDGQSFIFDVAYSADRLYRLARVYDRPTRSYVNELIVTEPKAATSVHAALSTKHPSYGAPITVAVRTTGLPAGTSYEIDATVGGQVQEIATGTVDDRGRGESVVRLGQSIGLSVRYSGDDTRDASATRSMAVKVSARVLTRYRGARGHVGRYAVYRATDRWNLLTRVAPDHTGDCITVESQVLVSGRWHPAGTSSCVRLGRGSAIIVVQQGDRRLAGLRVRQRVILPRDDRNVRTLSNWTYVRFTR